MSDDAQTPAEAEVAADEQAGPEGLADPNYGGDDPTGLVAEEEPAKAQYIEFVGTAPYGTEFYTKTVGGVAHTITAKHMRDTHDIDLGKREVSWTRGTNGRFLVSTSDLTPEAVEYLKTDPMFKLVEL